jgi:hypothetical protein
VTPADLLEKPAAASRVHVPELVLPSDVDVDVHREGRRYLGGLRVNEQQAPPELLAEGLRQRHRFSDREWDAVMAGEALLVERPDALEGQRLRVVPLVAGGALGSGAVYQRNLPAPGSYVVDPVRFAGLTSKNRKVSVGQAFPGYGAGVNFRFDAVGIIGRAILMFEGTGTSPATAPIATRQWPWNFAKSLTVSANGINNLFACEGADLRALCRVRNYNMLFDRESAFAIPTATNAATVRLFYEIPIAYDDSLIGAVFAQTEETAISVTLTQAVAADLFTVAGNALTWTNATWRLITEFFSIPTVDDKDGRRLVIPDITQLHGVVSRDDALSATGDHFAPLTRTGGILLRGLQRIDNVDAGNLDPTASITSHRFRYGGNVVPLELPGSAARWQNEVDYGDAILPTSDAVSGGSPPAYLVDDFVVDSPIRDAIHMQGITEAQMINTIAGGTVINAGAKVHTVQESMVAG